MFQFEMFETTSLGLKPPKRQEMDDRQSLFFGLRPPKPVAASMQNQALQVAARLGLRGLKPARNLHLSLNGIAKDVAFDGALLVHAQQIGNAVTVGSFELVFDRLLNFGNKAPYRTVATCTEGVTGLDALYDAIRGQMGPVGLSAPKRVGVPHITLCFSDTPVPMQGLSSPFRWTVNDFWLIHSHTGQGRHTWPGHWSLRD